jgi:hypothetical protein
MEVSDPAISVLAEGLLNSYDVIYLDLYLPARVYGNSDVQKFYILKENKEKSPRNCAGPLRRDLFMKEFSKFGSAINLRRRFYIYYSLKILTSNTSMYIYRALLKSPRRRREDLARRPASGYSNFSLEIRPPEFYTPGVASPPRVTYIIYIKRIKIYIYSLNAGGGSTPQGARSLSIVILKM